MVEKLKRTEKRIVLLCALFLLSLNPNIAQSDTPHPLKIGVLLALTGPYPLQGNAFKEGLILAEREINESGGINGTPLRLIIEDTANEARNAISAAKKLATQDKVVAALMSSYPEYRTGGMELQRSQIPVIALWDSSPELDDMGDYIFGIGPWTPSSGEVSALFARTQLQAKRAVIINSVDPWAELVADYFARDFTRLGGEIIKRLAINPETSDFRSIILQARTANGDVVFAPIINHIPEFFIQRATQKWSTPVLSSDIIAQNHIDIAGKAIEGVYQAKNRDPSLGSSSVLLHRYRATFHRDPPLPWFVTTAYDSVMMLAQAMQAGNLSGSSIKTYLSTLREFKGVTQEFSFTSGGSAPQLSVMHQVVGGKLVLVWEPPAS
jgi:branched-chain amino acid transport system substrate-binding protein